MSASPLDRYKHFDEFDDPLETNEGTLTPAQRKARALANLGLTATAAELNAMDGVTATFDEINKAADVSSFVLELTATAAVGAGVRVLELNHASVVIAATWTVVPNTLFIVKDTSATGTAAHTLTLTGGTFNGTNTIATLNARDEMLVVWFDSAGRGQVIANVGAVALS
jgi:hypothetical protein